jgi:hypothetical protein
MAEASSQATLATTSKSPADMTLKSSINLPPFFYFIKELLLPAGSNFIIYPT